jgi:serine/threonine-protein kinase RsbW
MLSQLRLMMCLPRDAASVVLARRVLDGALALMGLTEDCRADMALALTEACANVINHAGVGQEYEVTVAIHRDLCVMEVIDSGVGLDHLIAYGERLDVTALHGRGLFLIRAYTDALELRPVNPHGLAVRMSKRLTWSSPRPADSPPVLAAERVAV